MQYARFHLGHVQAADGSDVLSAAALEAMRDDPGPGGTLLVELDGMGVSWQLRPSAEGVRIVQHGGDWPGQHSGFLFVPERDFAITMLTNSNGGPRLVSELFIDDWALRTFAGLHNLPATPATYTAEQLAPYEGRYTREHVPPDGTTAHADLQLTAEDGGLRLRNLDQNESPLEPPQGTPASLIFYRDDYVLALDSDGKAFGPRANFVRGADGAVEWFRFGGRLSRRVV